MNDELVLKVVGMPPLVFVGKVGIVISEHWPESVLRQSDDGYEIVIRGEFKEGE